MASVLFVTIDFTRSSSGFSSFLKSISGFSIRVLPNGRYTSSHLGCPSSFRNP